jgi:NDP-sugar pyrophosphorylase family protein
LIGVVLCGGFGTRLRPVLATTPKSLAPVLGRPFLEWLLLYLRDQGLREVVLATGYMSSTVESIIGDGSRFGLRIVYSPEDQPLGTGGALKSAAARFAADRGPLLVLNGDSFCRWSLQMVALYHGNHVADATIVLARERSAERFGRVALAADGQVVSFDEKSVAGPGLVNAGIYLVESPVIDRIPAQRTLSLERDILPGLVGERFFGIEVDGPLIDIGTPESYQAAATELRPLIEDLASG